MPDQNQIVTPPSFIALFVEPGRIKPSATREFIAERYEFCEDLATLFVDPAKGKLWELGIAQEDVLQRIRRGLLTAEAGVNPAEAAWVLRRLAELLDWEWSEAAAGADGAG